MDLSARFHFAGRTYAVRIAEEETPRTRPIVAVTCLEEPTDAPGWVQSVQWPDDDEVSRAFGISARFWEAGEGGNEALYAVGGGVQ